MTLRSHDIFFRCPQSYAGFRRLSLSFTRTGVALRRPKSSGGRPRCTRTGSYSEAAREIDAGLERGRRALDGIVREVRQRTRTPEQRSTLTIDELLAAAKTASYGVSRLVDLAELELTRRKRRAVAKAIEKGAMPTIDQMLAILAGLAKTEQRAVVGRLLDVELTRRCCAPPRPHGPRRESASRRCPVAAHRRAGLRRRVYGAVIQRLSSIRRWASSTCACASS